MIEVQVHQQLHAYLREQHHPSWPHHLTMARLVARALRLGRSSLIQTGTQGRYQLSYLLPILVWPGPVILVAPESHHQSSWLAEIPQLQHWLQSSKTILRGDRWPSSDFQGLLLTTPEAWLADRLRAGGAFPSGIPVVLDGADELENWVRDTLTAGVHPNDWNDLRLAFPHGADRIRDLQAQLTRTIFQHPPNPYQCHLLETDEQAILQQLYTGLGMSPLAVNPPEAIAAVPKAWPHLPVAWQQFWQLWQQSPSLLWSTASRTSGSFSLYGAPADLGSTLAQLWPQQPVILIGSALDLDTDATVFRRRIGINDVTCVKFLPDRHHELLQLYLPDELPMPNTPQFQVALSQEIRRLLAAQVGISGFTVLIVGDLPLKAQIGTMLAAEFGSRVQVEKTSLDEHSILVTGWEFWRQHQTVLPRPQLLGIATLPLPSLENPLVAGRVAYYKQTRQDWFRLYLLPTALSELQRAIAGVRENQGLVALFDSRVIHRSYGKQILAALSPVARTNYLDVDQSLMPFPYSSIVE